jgi:glycine hydroxymethyltransferase
MIDFKRFKEIADKVGAYLMCDIAHISALVAHGLHPSPVGIADFITFTTHKMLAGPRGGVIIYKQDYDKEIKLSTIPSLFGGPLEQQIYAKLVCFKEQLNNGKTVAKNIIKNAKVMAETFTKYNVPLVSGGTDNHLMTVDLTDYSVTGKQMAEILEECGIIVNCNTVPNDKRSFLETSGIRIGVPAVTTRGLTQQDVKTLTRYISNLINACKEDYESDFDLLDKFEKAHDNLKWHVFDLIMSYPLKDFYPKMYNELFEAKELSWV